MSTVQEPENRGGNDVQTNHRSEFAEPTILGMFQAQDDMLKNAEVNLQLARENLDAIACKMGFVRRSQPLN